MPLFLSVITNRHLIWQLVVREIQAKYKGSILGLVWSFANPLFMLAVYTFLFSGVFQVKRGSVPSVGHIEYAVTLFVGLIVHSLATECINRAPTLIVANTNFVKKVLFPLELLPLVVVGSALYNAAIASIVLGAAQVVFFKKMAPTAILFPFVLIPFIIFLLGLLWLISALGVFIRDIVQMTSIVSTLLLFGSPIFYHRSALPADLQHLLLANPLTVIVEASRAVLVTGDLPNWLSLSIYTVLAFCFFCFGYWFFSRTRKGFADVL